MAPESEGGSVSPALPVLGTLSVADRAAMEKLALVDSGMDRRG